MSLPMPLGRRSRSTLAIGVKRRARSSPTTHPAGEDYATATHACKPGRSMEQRSCTIDGVDHRGAMREEDSNAKAGLDRCVVHRCRAADPLDRVIIGTRMGLARLSIGGLCLRHSVARNFVKKPLVRTSDEKKDRVLVQGLQDDTQPSRPPIAADTRLTSHAAAPAKPAPRSIRRAGYWDT